MKVHIILILLQLCLISSVEYETFTAEKLHLLHRLSSFVSSLDGKYIVYVNRLWDQPTGKYYNNLEYIELSEYQKKLKGEENSAVPLNITIPELGLTDSNPVFSETFPNHLFFLRTQGGISDIYYIDFPPKETSTPKKLTYYPINVANLQIKKDTLVFSAEVYFDCGDMQCTEDRNDEVAKRGSNTYSIYTKLMMRHWDFWYTEGKDSHPFYQKLKMENNEPKVSGDPVDMMKSEAFCSPPLENGAEHFSISDDGKLVAFSAHEKNEKMSYNTKWQIYLYNIDTKEKKLLTEEEGGRCQNPIFKPGDNDALAYLCMLHYGLESDQLSLRVYTPSTGEIKNETNPTTWMISSYIWDPINKDGRHFIINTVNEGRVTLFSFDFDEKTINTAYHNLTKDVMEYMKLKFYMMLMKKK